MKNKKYYIAYGSNLSVEQMADRCPDAKIAGQAVLAGWELLFRGCATIAPNPKKNGSGVGDLGKGRRKPRPL